ncbi:MAG: aspartate aminotransferase family protein [Actinobacteria bacterium]|nr:aspartate aminotransferase family protein [Actinomycetota bacterium]
MLRCASGNVGFVHPHPVAHSTVPANTQGTLREALEDVLRYANEFLDSLGERRVGWSATADELRATMGGPLPAGPQPPADVIRDLIKAADAGVVGTTSPRYFGFVIGGNTPATLAADWLTSVWDQNAGLFVGGPSASVAEEIAGGWLIELLGLPPSASFGVTTGGQMANFTGLAAARQHVLAQAGWDVEADGLQGAPPVRVIAGAQRHTTIDRALRYLGLGANNALLVETDDQGRMNLDAFRRILADTSGPIIVAAQVGNVNTGAFDPIGEISDAAHEKGGWVHVDGAFGLWAAVSPKYEALLQGHDRADSWATDAHKWLNVPYDAGLIFCAHPESHRLAMGTHASYLIHSENDAERDEMNWTPEFSRRARGFALYAAIRALGRTGITEIIERCCANAHRFAVALSNAENVEVLNDVVLNQVLVRFVADDGDHDARTSAVITGVQEDGTCWLSGSTWQGKGVMRISVSNWQTSTADVDRSVEAILRVASST